MMEIDTDCVLGQGRVCGAIDARVSIFSQVEGHNQR